MTQFASLPLKSTDDVAAEDDACPDACPDLDEDEAVIAAGELGYSAGVGIVLDHHIHAELIADAPPNVQTLPGVDERHSTEGAQRIGNWLCY